MAGNSLLLGPFQQTTFLGASIMAFDAQVGWNEQQGTLGVRVVEDPDNGDSFTPLPANAGSPMVGQPVYFNFMDFQYGGILQNWEQDNSLEGKPVYTVSVIDPREVLDGTQLILEGYNGSTEGIPNLLNPYGLIENLQGFGAAQVNGGGMPWYLVQLALSQMIGSNVSVNPAFGRPLSVMGYSYSVDLSNLPVMPIYYRIGGGNITLLEAITQVCQDAGCDYFLRLVFDPSIGNVIQVKTVSRVAQPVLGQIGNFVNQTSGVKAKMLGQEFRNEVTTAFVVGGQVQELFQQYGNDFGPGGEEFNTIWPFWGFDENGDAIVGTQDFESDKHTFTLDARSVNVLGVGSTYTTSVGEMRAAIAGEDAWRSYVASADKQKAQQLGITASWDVGENALAKLLSTPAAQLTPNDFINQGWDFVQSAGGRSNDTSKKETNLHNLYKFVSDYASEYYGRKFMVRIPFVNATLEPDTLTVNLSQQPCDGGWIDENAEPVGLPANYQDLFQDQEGKYQAFVRFDNPFGSGYDLSNLNPDDALVINEGLFVKVQVDPETVFLDASLYDSPRAVITMPGPVNDSGNALSQPWFDGLALLLQNKLIAQANFPPGFTITDQMRENIANGVKQGMGGLSYFGYSPAAVRPTHVAVPLRSNIATYGPWFNLGPPGKVRFERDESLVPWNYGGFDVMNLAGQAKVQEAVTYMQIGEVGRIEAPGAPTVQLGDVLVAGGPNVTQITCAVGKEGVSTTYHMRTYTPRPFGLSKANADRMTRLGRTGQQFRRGLRKLLLSTPPGDSPTYQQRSRFFTDPKASKLFKGASPHNIIMGSVVPTSGDYKECLVSDATFTEGLMNVQGQEDDLYYNAALASMDSIFTPYSVDTEYDGYMPHFEEPSGGGKPSVLELNPWGTGGHVMTNNAFATHGDTYPNIGPDGLSTKNTDFDLNTVRGLALKVPLVMAGYGYDTNGNPVPSGDSPGQFLDNYRNRPDMWKAGPLDCRWDASRKVWVAGTSQDKIAVVIAFSGWYSFPSNNPGFDVISRPRYVVREIDGLNGSGVMQFTPVDDVTPPMSGTNDSLVFNIQEAYGDLHTLGVGTPVLLHEQFGVKFVNEHVRTLMQRILY